MAVNIHSMRSISRSMNHCLEVYLEVDILRISGIVGICALHYGRRLLPPAQGTGEQNHWLRKPAGIGSEYIH